MEFTFAQLREAEKVDLGASSWMPIDQSRIDAFAEATDDRQWIHIDPDRAKKSQWGNTIAHGFLLVSVVPRLFTELFRVPEAKMLVNYGVDKIRFIHPVPCNSAVQLACRIASVKERAGNMLVRVRGELSSRALEDEGDTRRSVLLDILFLVVPPDPETA
ncbi:MAG: MaoC family dehydratase [Acidobacteriota bacterium]